VTNEKDDVSARILELHTAGMPIEEAIDAATNPKNPMHPDFVEDFYDSRDHDYWEVVEDYSRSMEEDYSIPEEEYGWGMS